MRGKTPEEVVRGSPSVLAGAQLHYSIGEAGLSIGAGGEVIYMPDPRESIRSPAPEAKAPPPSVERSHSISIASAASYVRYV